MNRLRNILRFCCDRLRACVGKRPTKSSGSEQKLVASVVASPVQIQLENALGFLQSGNLDQAETIYRSLLQVDSSQSEALHLLGVVQAQRQNLTEAAALIGQAIEIDPENAAAHSNHGNVLKALRRNNDALVSYDQALALSPDWFEVLNNRGAVLGDLGRHDDALASYGRALEAAPEHVDALINRGSSLIALKRHREALADFDRALAINHLQPQALFCRGVALAALGKYPEALLSFDRVLEVNPGHVEALSDRGSVLAATGRLEGALESYDRVLKINATHPETLFNRGNVLTSLAQYEDALLSYDHALAAKPGYREAQLKRCATLGVLKRFDEALIGYDQALANRPSDIEALFNRGVVLVELERYADAVASYDRALGVEPEFVEAFNNRGIALWHARQYEDAVASYDRALTLRPEYADALYNRGVVLSRKDRKDEALASYDKAIAVNSDYVAALNNSGVLLAEMRRFDDAVLRYDRALAITPDSVEALANRGEAFRAMKLHERAAQDDARLLELAPDYDYVIGKKFASDLQGCDWVRYYADKERVIDAIRAGKRASFPFSFLISIDAGPEQLQCARTYVAHKCPLAVNPLWRGERYAHQKIHIAYLSADFHGHATSYLMAELFEKHDREKFEVTAWSFGPEANDSMRARLQESFDQFNDVRQMTDVEVATMLRAQEVDIAIDLKGFTNDSRTAILAHRAAPIQVNYLAYPGTMGADYMDYIIGDATVIPRGHETFYAESVVRLPDTYQVNDSKREISDRVFSRSECRLPQSGFVFCCFNKNYKIVPEIFDIWMRLLKNVHGSVLWLFDDNAAAFRNLRAAAVERGVQAERLVFAPQMSLSDHLARHKLADLFLDTLPCNAHTTASDALWAGLPVLTCMGNAFAGRVAASLLRAIGLPELITANLADYEALALKLATTPSMLNEMKAKLARNRDTYPLFDADRFRRHIESAYITMYERHQRGEPPESFSVEPIDAGEK